MQILHVTMSIIHVNDKCNHACEYQNVTMSSVTVTMRTNPATMSSVTMFNAVYTDNDVIAEHMNIKCM